VRRRVEKNKAEKKQAIQQMLLASKKITSNMRYRRI
jgi:hypothetical protein